MKDRAEYAQKGIARGRSLVATTYDEGILAVAENPSRSLHKISEIYDRIAFGGVGKYNEYDQLRVAGVRHADTKGFAYSREDVDARSLANLYAQHLGNVFTHEMEAARGGDSGGRARRRGTAGPAVPHRLRGDDHRRGALHRAGGDAETITEPGDLAWQDGWNLETALKGGGGPGRAGAHAGRRRSGVATRSTRGNGRRTFPAVSSKKGWRNSWPERQYGGLVERRIFGIENEYGVTFTLRGQRRLSPDGVARYLFRLVVSWGRSSNVFLENGARLYLDVGSHPEYATPECDKISDVVVHDKAGGVDSGPAGHRGPRPARGARGDPRRGSTSSRTTPTRSGTPLRLPRELPPHRAQRRVQLVLHRGAHRRSWSRARSRPASGQDPADAQGGGVLPRRSGPSTSGKGVSSALPPAAAPSSTTRDEPHRRRCGALPAPPT